jgi:nucleoside-diphosphate-sugar epimerase
VIVGAGDNALPFVYVTDVVEGLLLALDNERALGRAYNITNECPLTQAELLSAIAEATGAKPPRVHLPYRPLYAAGYAAERVAALMRSRSQPVVTRLGVKLFGTDNRHAIEKARAELGFSPRVDLADGVRLAAGWYLGQAELPLAAPAMAVAR